MAIVHRGRKQMILMNRQDILIKMRRSSTDQNHLQINKYKFNRCIIQFNWQLCI